MIRYLVTRDELEARINAIDDEWLADAAARTRKFCRAGRYTEAKGNWGKIKVVYMRLQHAKCAYCERKLEGPPDGAIEHDVEHFRPKNAVPKWPTATIAKRRKLTYDFATGDAGPGYYSLAYNIFNYVTSCKVCNTRYKRSYFPILGARGAPSADHQAYASEQALLIYPLGDVDADPEALITFEGIVPTPVVVTGVDSRRARVTIDFFNLDGRDHLRDERARCLRTLWMALLVLESNPGPELRTLAETTIADCTAPSSAHSSCAKAFHAAYVADRAKAEAYFMDADNVLTGKAARSLRR